MAAIPERRNTGATDRLNGVGDGGDAGVLLHEALGVRPR
jgi:hypothetical protein